MTVPYNTYNSTSVDNYDIHCRRSCNDANSNHIGIYSGYNSDRLFRRICGTYGNYRVTFYGQYAYINFHTNSQANSQRFRGFSRGVFTAQGLFIAGIGVGNKWLPILLLLHRNVLRVSPSMS